MLMLITHVATNLGKTASSGAYLTPSVVLVEHLRAPWLHDQPSQPRNDVCHLHAQPWWVAAKNAAAELAYSFTFDDIVAKTSQNKQKRGS
jgi:DNA-binding IscR family transcriptional regulator